MTIHTLDPVANSSPEALCGFLAECRDTAAENGRPMLVSITIQVESSPSPPMVIAVLRFTEAILANLLSNALKFSPPDSVVTPRFVPAVLPDRPDRLKALVKLSLLKLEITRVNAPEPAMSLTTR